VSPDRLERELAARVLDALLREDYGGLAGRVEVAALRLPGPGGALVPLAADGFLQDLAVRRPSALRLDQVLDALAAIADPADRAGVTAFVRECRETLATLRLDARHHRAVLSGLGPAGLGVTTWYDALAAHVDHPVYPTARCRLGLGARDLRRHAPEFHPAFELEWVALPRQALARAGQLPEWWPGPADVGLPSGLAASHELVPVHPLTTRRLAAVIANAGDRAPRRYLRVTPTLSMRTVAVQSHPDVHVKLPLPTSTLGLRNRRSLVPRTLADAALVQRVLQAVLDREPRLPVLLADEGTYGHAHHEYLAYVVRRFPARLADARVVPVAALLAPAPSGRPVVEELAAEHTGGDVVALLDAYLRVLFDAHVTLLVRHGVALETHQQNLSLVLRRDGSPPGLLLKDYDGALVHPGWLGSWAPRPAFADERMLTGDPGDLVNVFVTITLHLCAAAPAFGLARSGLAPLPELLALVRRRFEGSLAAHDGNPRADLLRARVLEVDRLPGKSMVIAGTLVDKARSGARDVNKHFGATGPNYLRS
jgi:siderophore synthetase component